MGDLIPELLTVLTAVIAGLFTAVVGGLVYTYIWVRHNDKKKRESHLRALKKELITCQERLSSRQASRVSTHIWKSILNAGLLSLFLKEVQEKLTEICDSLDIQNYAASVAYQVGTFHNLAVDLGGSVDNGTIDSLPESLDKRWVRISENIHQREERLTTEISKLLQEPWWPD